MAATNRYYEGRPSETSPLLGKSSNGHIKPANALHDPSSDDDTTLVDEPSTGELLLALSGVWFGCFLAALDSTIIATLSAPISASFHSLSLLSWLASAYLIANAALQPLSGRLTDILGRRAGLVFSNFFFAAGNLICGLAQDESVMIFGRAVAGMGGGGLTAISTFVASDLIPLRKRGLWQGFGNVCYGVGAGLGGVFGGWINDVWGWRVAFLILVPLTVISGILVFFTIHIPIKKSEKSTWKRIDFLGAVTLILTLVLLLLGVNSGGNIVPWTHPLVLVSLPLSAVFLLLFIYIEANIASEPVIPVRLLLDRTVLSACFTNWFSTMWQFAILFYGPIYFQVKGLSATAAGTRLIPSSIGLAVGSLGSGFIMRATGRYYLLSVCSQLTSLTALVIVATFQLNTPSWEAFVAFFLAGMFRFIFLRFISTQFITNTPTRSGPLCHANHHPPRPHRRRRSHPSSRNNIRLLRLPQHRLHNRHHHHLRRFPKHPQLETPVPIQGSPRFPGNHRQVEG